MSERIIEGLKDAAAGKVSRVTVWAEEPGIALVVEPRAGDVVLTIRAAMSNPIVTATIARWRWDQIVALTAPVIRPSIEGE
jgi:hypothetical protein